MGRGGEKREEDCRRQSFSWTSGTGAGNTSTPGLGKNGPE